MMCSKEPKASKLALREEKVGIGNAYKWPSWVGANFLLPHNNVQFCSSVLQTTGERAFMAHFPYDILINAPYFHVK